MSDDPLAALSLPGLDVAGAGRLLRRAFAPVAADGAAVEARMLLAHVLGLDLTGLMRDGARPLGEAAAGRLAALAARRLSGEPIQRVIGSAGFFGLDLALSPETLVPRSDTETLVEVVLARFEAGKPFVFADLGVGSGAILLALLDARPSAFGIGTDLSAEALSTARANAERLGLGARAAFARGSYATMLAPGRFDAIVSNPPYIASAEIESLDPEVRLHDPRRALDGGADGLDAYRALVPQAAEALVDGGLLAVEIGSTQATAVTAIFEAEGFDEIGLAADLAGRDRVVLGRRGTGARKKVLGNSSGNR